ncbi:MAG: hypothetical protein H8E81_08120 [Deltaproteobacteria bacterium]|nr:hypothetical protein [Deltaproteobacteria bacterium]
MNDRKSKSHADRPVRILFETGAGRSASALLENNFLQHCLDMGAEMHVLSPGACFEPFVERYRLPGIHFHYLSIDSARRRRYKRWTHREANWGARLSRKGLGSIRRAMWQVLGERINAVDGGFMSDLVDKVQPDCFFTANLNLGFSRGLVSMCGRRSIPTVGNIFSWDHPYYEQHSRPDHLTCWSDVVRDGLVKMRGFLPEQIDVIGAPVFDAYFDPDGIWSRNEFCNRMGLDSQRPILLFATLGQMQAFRDETGTFRAFLAAVDQAGIPGPPQIILRLHPRSIDHYYHEFRSRQDVVFSRYLDYCPGMRWLPSRDEVILAGNLLRHADVCVSPGSTMLIEAAIFDTPTIVPTFNPMMKEDYDRFFKKDWLNKHLGFLLEENAVGVAHTTEELIAVIQRGLSDPEWLKDGRQKIREKLLGPLDGKATERLAQFVVETGRKAAVKN